MINRPSTLGFIAVLLLASAAVRGGYQLDWIQANASENDMLGEKEDQPSEGANILDPAASTEDTIITIDLIVSELEKRESELDQRSLEIEAETQRLQELDARIRESLQELRQAEASLERNIALSATAAEDDLSRLTAVYENMKPKDAAKVFEEMTPEFAAGFMSRMRPDAAASILAGMDSNTAYSISVVMAGRNANAVTE